MPVYDYIVDYLAKDGDIACFRALMNRSLDELEKRECDIASIWALGEPTLRDQLLKGLGFKSSLMFPYSRFSRRRYFNVRRINEQAAAEVDIYDKKNWRVTYAYSDTIYLSHYFPWERNLLGEKNHPYLNPLA